MGDLARMYRCVVEKSLACRSGCQPDVLAGCQPALLKYLTEGFLKGAVCFAFARSYSS